MPLHDQSHAKTPAPISSRRIPLMVLGGLFLLGAGVVALWYPERDGLQASLTRLGIVVGTLGYALPRPGEKFHWGGTIFFVIALCLAIPAAKRLIPVALMVLVPLMILLTFFRPRQKPPPLR